MTPITRRRIKAAILFAIVVAAAAFVGPILARAHDAPTGWQFDQSCCSNRDCGEVPADWIIEGDDGVTVIPSGEFFTYGDSKIRQSKDENTYWCRPPGVPNPKTICVYLPLRSF